MKICFSYSVDANYIPYVVNSIKSLNTNSPEISAYVDLINVPEESFSYSFNNTIVNFSSVDINDSTITIKNKGSSIIRERTVKLSGAYANVTKVKNISYLLENFDFDYVVNMDADNIILKNVADYIKKLPQNYDIYIKYDEGRLEGAELDRRLNNFKHFNVDAIDIHSLDKHFREGCMVVRNTPASKKFFKYVADNIHSRIAWYADSYWICRSYIENKGISIFKLPNDFVIYEINEETIKNAFIVSGYSENKYSSFYKKLCF
jgi:hypothetical protein